MVQGQLQARRETLQLPLPVAQQRHRRHHQGGGRERVGEQGGDQLGGLTQAHVIGQAGPQPQLAEEHQPAKAPLLIGPQLTGETSGAGQGFGPAVQIAGEQGAQGPGRLHPRQLQLRRHAQPLQAEAATQQLGAAGLTRLARQAQQSRHGGGIHQGPLAAQAHQRPLQGGSPLQGLQIGLAERLIAQHRLPLELEEPAQIQAAAGAGRGRLATLAPGGLDLGPQPQPRHLAQAAGQQHPEAGLRQQGRPAAHQAHQLPFLQLQLGGGRLPQQRRQLRRQAGEQAQLLQHRLEGTGRKRGAAGPEIGQGQQQAGIGGGPQQQLDGPAAAAAIGRLVAAQGQAQITAGGHRLAHPAGHLLDAGARGGGQRPW